MAIVFLLDPEVAKNDGCFRPIEIVAKEGTIVRPREGAPVTMCTSHCANEIVEAVVKALANACPDRAMGGWGRRFRIAIKGSDARRPGRPSVWHLFHARPGGGGSSQGDGWSNAGEWHSAGGLKFGSVEMAEARFPLFFAKHEFRPGSRAMAHRGGLGAELGLKLETDGPAVGNTAGDGVRHGAAGMLGGKDGAAASLHTRARRRHVARLEDKGSRHRARAGRHVARARGRRRRMGASRETRPAGPQA